MKIAVTGGLGTVGAPLVRALREAGHDVASIDLRHAEDGFRADVGEYREIENVLRQCMPDFVYHLAAEFGRHNGEDYYERLWRSNVVGTKNMLKLQARMGFEMIFSSSSEVYGESSRPVLSEEDVAHHPHHLTNDYAVTKWVNESQIEMARKRWGSPVMVLRFFNAYGPGEFYHSYRSVVCLFVYRALMGLPYEVYQGYHRVFQYIDDLIDTLARGVDAFRPGMTMNVGGVEYRSVEEMHQIVSEVVGVDPDRELVTRLPHDEHNIVNKRPDISLASLHLRHNPRITLEDGIRNTVAWMREHYECPAHQEKIRHGAN